MHVLDSVIGAYNQPTEVRGSLRGMYGGRIQRVLKHHMEISSF